jgi:hypothetical protein
MACIYIWFIYIYTLVHARANGTDNVLLNECIEYFTALIRLNCTNTLLEDKNGLDYKETFCCDRN